MNISIFDVITVNTIVTQSILLLILNRHFVLLIFKPAVSIIL